MGNVPSVPGFPDSVSRSLPVERGREKRAWDEYATERIIGVLVPVVGSLRPRRSPGYDLHLNDLQNLHSVSEQIVMAVSRIRLSYDIGECGRRTRRDFDRSRPVELDEGNESRSPVGIKYLVHLLDQFGSASSAHVRRVVYP